MVALTSSMKSVEQYVALTTTIYIYLEQIAMMRICQINDPQINLSGDGTDISN
jgi:hypothetical protein